MDLNDGHRSRTTIDDRGGPADGRACVLRELDGAFAAAATALRSADELALLDAAVSIGFLAERAAFPLAMLVERLTTITPRDTHRVARSWRLMACALKSFAVAHAATTVRRARAVRHDLRNPLGTASNALSLLGDELADGHVAAASAERLRAMAARNVATGEALVRTELSDRAALVEWPVDRRGLAAALDAIAGALPSDGAQLDASAIDQRLGRRFVDATVLELSVRAIAAGCDPSATLRAAACEEADTERIRVLLSSGSDVRSTGETLASRVLTRAGGGLVRCDDALVLALPLALSGDERNDLAGGGEREDRNTERA